MRTNIQKSWVAAIAIWAAATGGFGAELEKIAIPASGRGFVRSPSGVPFVPWGVNYDHDGAGRLIEDYWSTEWDTVVQDFQEIRDLKANVVRIHLQLGKFMASPHEANQESLDRLRQLLKLAEQTGLYLNLTGLACYHKQDVPDWYDGLSEEERWGIQVRFWEAIAETCRESNAVFCYDLMNEPVVAVGDGQQDWLGPAFGGKHFVQRITLRQGDRTREEIAKKWIRQLTQAIRSRDSKTLITVGLVDWSLDRPGLRSGFVPDKVCDDLDFVSVHLYPKSGKLAEDLETLRGFAIGKPLVIEEIFPLKAGPEETLEFIRQSRQYADGWFSFYWGKTIEDLTPAESIVDGIVANWLRHFRDFDPTEVGETDPR